MGGMCSVVYRLYSYNIVLSIAQFNSIYTETRGLRLRVWYVALSSTYVNNKQYWQSMAAN